MQDLVVAIACGSTTMQTNEDGVPQRAGPTGFRRLLACAQELMAAAAPKASMRTALRAIGMRVVWTTLALCTRRDTWTCAVAWSGPKSGRPN